jgi:hypothetical protein
MKARSSSGRTRASRDMELPLHLQFPVSDIALLAAAYRLDDKEHAALAAGARIRAGACSRDNLAPILTWKVSDRGRSRPLRNSDEEVADALRTALLASTPRAAVAVLIGLSGVAVPIASAILAAIKPEQYGVLDNRGLRALGCGPLEIGPRQSMPLDLYLNYLQYCRRMASDCQVSLHTLERAFWQWANSCDRLSGNTLFPRRSAHSTAPSHQI